MIKQAKNEVFYKVFLNIEQWFSTLGSWRPTKQNKTEFGDPFSIKVLYNTVFGDPKVSSCDPKVGRDPRVENHWHRASLS